jgi:hypothetical protein
VLRERRERKKKNKYELMMALNEYLALGSACQQFAMRAFNAALGMRESNGGLT